MFRLPLSSGQEIAFDYPSHNILGLPLEYVRRRVRVESTQDVAAEPLEAAAFFRRPLVRRGSLLLFAHDLDLDLPRKFWVEAMQQVDQPGDAELPSYRLGLYDPEESDELVDWVGRIFRPTVRDRLVMRDAIVRCEEMLREKQETDLRLAAFPVED